MTFFVDAFVVGADTGDPVVVVKKFRSGESGENRDPRLFHFATQPLHKSIQRNYIVAVIAQERRRNRQFELALPGEKVDRFFGDFGIEWSFFFKSGEQFAHGSRIEQRAREAMLSNLAR